MKQGWLQVDGVRKVRELLVALSAEYFYHPDASPVPPHALATALAQELKSPDRRRLLADVLHDLTAHSTRSKTTFHQSSTVE